jgi:hypothetical protein
MDIKRYGYSEEYLLFRASFLDDISEMLKSLESQIPDNFDLKRFYYVSEKMIIDFYDNSHGGVFFGERTNYYDGYYLNVKESIWVSCNIIPMSGYDVYLGDISIGDKRYAIKVLEARDILNVNRVNNIK